MAATTTIRIDQQLRDRLSNLAHQEQKTLGEIVKEAIDRYERDKFFAAYHRAFADLQADPEDWADYQSDLALWDTTLNDGLEGEPWTE